MFRLPITAIAMAAMIAQQVSAGSGLECRLGWLDSIASDESYVEAQRAKGPAGLAETLEQFDYLTNLTRNLEPITGGAGGRGEPADDERRQGGVEGCQRLARIADQIAGQRGATASRLFWYTDLEAAKKAAAESDRPILSLRMLGKLTDELSCANSRFFRTALYTNVQIGDFLRDNYVLHWQSVRPVPRVTIDFGDGRKLERTVTGNSAHYVLDAAGQPLDALPGLYGPRAFQDWLTRSKELADRLAPVSSDVGRVKLLAEYHASRQAAIDESLRADLANVAPELLTVSLDVTEPVAINKAAPSARKAGGRAYAKGGIEARLVAQVVLDGEMLAAQDDDLWQRIAAGHADQARLDDASVALMRREYPPAQVAGALAVTKRQYEDPIVRVLRNFEQAMAVDTVKNEYLLHRRIHEWFASGVAIGDVEELNERVYAELFLTPSSDPWLGLAPDDVYTALDDGGLFGR